MTKIRCSFFNKIHKKSSKKLINCNKNNLFSPKKEKENFYFSNKKNFSNGNLSEIKNKIKNNKNVDIGIEIVSPKKISSTNGNNNKNGNNNFQRKNKYIISYAGNSYSDIKNKNNEILNSKQNPFKLNLSNFKSNNNNNIRNINKKLKLTENIHITKEQNLKKLKSQEI